MASCDRRSQFSALQTMYYMSAVMELKLGKTLCSQNDRVEIDLFLQ